ncbi:MAG: recombination protein NinB [Pseudomonadota bacterium]
MSRAVLELNGRYDREKAANWIALAPAGTRVEFKKPRRSNEANAMMWVLLTAVAGQLEWHGQKLSSEDWKDYFMHSFRRARWVPDEDGGMVPIGMRTSDLSKEEMGDLIELIQEFGARHGVEFEREVA